VVTAFIIDDEIRSGLLLKAKIENITDYFDTIESFSHPHQACRSIIENLPDIIFQTLRCPR